MGGLGHEVGAIAALGGGSLVSLIKQDAHLDPPVVGLDQRLENPKRLGVRVLGVDGKKVHRHINGRAGVLDLPAESIRIVGGRDINRLGEGLGST